MKSPIVKVDHRYHANLQLLMNRQVPILRSILLRMVYRYIKGLDMDDIVATREWINQKMEARGDSGEMNCNMTMREIVDVIEWPYDSDFVYDMFYDIFPGRTEHAHDLQLDIELSLVRDFIPFV